MGRGHRLSEEKVRELVDLIDDGASYRQAAAKAGVPVGTVHSAVWKYRKRIAASNGAASDSLRDLILEALDERSSYGDVAALRDHLRVMNSAHNFGDHEVIHILFSLRKQGLVTFKETHVGTQTRPTSIALTLPGKEALVEPAPAPASAPVTPTSDPYPLLANIRAREVVAQRKAEAIEHLLAAADLLGDDALMERAAVIEQQSVLTAVELEYLRYSKDHHRD